MDRCVETTYPKYDLNIVCYCSQYITHCERQEEDKRKGWLERKEGLNERMETMG